MSTIHFTPIVNGDPRKNDASIWNDPLGELDEALVAQGNYLQGQINNVIIDDGEANAEVAAARVRIPHGDPPAVLGDTIEYVSGDIANVKAFGALGDGVTDDNAAIQAAVDAAQIVYFPPGDYLIDDLTIPSDVTLFAYGGATLKMDAQGTGATAYHCIKINGSGVTLRGLNFAGDDGDENAILINLEVGNLDNIRIERCRFTNLNRPIRIKSYTATNRTASNIWITDNHFEDILGYTTIDAGIGINPGATPGGVTYSVDGLRIERNTFIDCAPESSGISFSGCIFFDDTTVYRVWICDNQAFRVGPLFVRAGNTKMARWDFVIRGNTVRQQGTTNPLRMGYELVNVDNLIFTENSVYFVEYECLYLQGCRNFKVANCHFEDCNIGVALTDTGAYRWRSVGTIDNCTFLDCECPIPASLNSAHAGITIASDGAEVNITNCRFSTINGNKANKGIDVDTKHQPPRWSRAFGITDDAPDFIWVSAGSGTYYLKRAGGFNPRISFPAQVFENNGVADGSAITLTFETMAGTTLSASSRWAWEDKHTLGYKTLYVRLSDDAAPGHDEVTVAWARLGINISNCRFEQLTQGMLIQNGGSTNYPGHARVVNCAFSRCTTAVQFVRAIGNVVMGCSFQGNIKDVYTTLDTIGLRCVYNYHRDTNPADDPASGAYVIDMINSADRLYEISGCTFRNVKNMHINTGPGTGLGGGQLSARSRMLIWRDNDTDAPTSTGAPSNQAVITALTNVQKILTQQSAPPGSGTGYTDGDLILNSDPDAGETLGWMGVGTGFGNMLPLIAQTNYGVSSGAPTASALFIGQEHLDTTNNKWYKSKAVGTGAADWVALN